MSSQSFLKHSLKSFFTIAGVALSALLTSPDLAKAGLGSDPDCPARGNSSSMSSSCFETPEVMEIEFFELGFCTSNPLATDTFSNDNCEKAWARSSGQTIDLAASGYQTLSKGDTLRVIDNTYTHAYVVVGNTWGLKGKVYFNGKTYFTEASTGSVIEDESNYGKFDYTIKSMTGTEGGSDCWDYTNTTDYGPIKAVITNSSLTTATNSTTCNATSRLVGVIDLANDLTIGNSTKGYRLEWIITKMGLLAHEDGAAPSEFVAGPFVPNFTLRE